MLSQSVGRLHPCPCGSQRRFKDCHGKLTPKPWTAKAMQARARGDLAGAKQAIVEALRDESDLDALDVAGMIAHDELDLEGAIGYFRRAIALAPSWAEAHLHLSICHLLRSDYAAGWQEFSWRHRIPGPANFAHHPFGIPAWKGESVAGRRILVHAEQGLGDTIHFARFAQALTDEGAQVEIFCHEPLVPLLSRMPGVHSATSDLHERPTQSFHCSLGDLAARYVPDPASKHWPGPYIRPKEEFSADWKRQLGPMRRPLVGLVWKGNPLHVNDRNRSLTGGRDAAQLITENATWLSLQLPAAGGLHDQVVDLGDQIRNWEDSCAIVDSLDLVVTVDTAMAHLAGAMRKPVWTLIPYCPDWRWGLGGETTPWYPSMRLFRQDAIGDWTSVITAVRSELQRTF